MVRNALCLSVCLSVSILLPLGLSHTSWPRDLCTCCLLAGMPCSSLHPPTKMPLSQDCLPRPHLCLPARAPTTDISILEPDGSAVSPPGGHSRMTCLVGCCHQAPGSHSFPLLSPQHVFCEECLCLWLDRERTCPLCRSVAVDTLRCWKDGATSAHLQVY